ncbi:LacI family DNA-binding transcriptional regulator [Roseibacterium sp. SDUM158017]|uniref:LacI family DNA-binding transcriptional regulator n=1 Tax=Roseicyclus salinarum TaxID=3036773 RepID=UPI002414E344|nr:LacI family DNA-binding transcriptional regulator [Roseibacterium sp. SDUM158017]MDG4649132.1 LacI family DNA-binding transcriptional regulator [Roseibacterium sp. SDUM158017]
MSERRATATDVARRAGVSQSAVSRVFTPGASVSKAMADRVRKAADELGYRPNVLARSLITGRTRMVGLVVGYLENPFYPAALEALSAALESRGYHILVFHAAGGGHAGDVERVVGELMDYQVDGLVTASVHLSDELVARCRAAGLPVVLFNRGLPGSGLSSVTSANRAGGAAVAEFLIAGGHERIAHISGLQTASTGVDRWEGFRAALEAAGRGVHALADGGFDRERAAAAARAMLSGPEPPDAIFVANDHMALGVLDEVRHAMGIDVPGAVSVVGYDDVPPAAWKAYDLTTVRQPVDRMVTAAVEILVAEIERGQPPGRVTEVAAELVVRGSARKPENVI